MIPAVHFHIGGRNKLTFHLNLHVVLRVRRGQHEGTEVLTGDIAPNTSNPARESGGGDDDRWAAVVKPRHGIHAKLA